MKEEIFTTAIN